jgi:hypothetical protein
MLYSWVAAIALFGRGGVARAQLTPLPDADSRIPPAVQVGEGLFIGPFVFSPSIEMVTIYDDNVFKVEDGYDPDGRGEAKEQHPQGGGQYNARARLALKLPFSRSYVSLIWKPLYHSYVNLDTPLNTSHQVDLDTRLNFYNGSSLRLSDSFIDGFFEARRLDVSSTYRLSATPFRRNLVDLDYDWSFAGVWGISGRVEHIGYTYDKTEVVNFQDTATGQSSSTQRLFDFFDYQTGSVETRAYRMLSRYKIYGEGTFSQTDQDRTNFNESQLEANGCNDPFTSTDPIEILDHEKVCRDLEQQIDTEHIEEVDAAVGILGWVTALTQADFKIGYSRWTFQNGANKPFAGVSYTGNFEHRFTRRTTGFLSLRRTPLQASGQYTGYYLYQEAVVTVDHQLTPNLTGRAEIAFRNSDFPGSEKPFSEAFTLNDLSGLFELRYRPRTRDRLGPLLITLGYAPQRSTSTQPGLDINSQRIRLGLQYGWF